MKWRYWLPAAACLLVLARATTYSQGSAEDQAFTIIERLPGVESNGSSEFAPLAVGWTHAVLLGHTDIALFRKAVGNESTRQISKVSVRTFFANPPGPVNRLADPDVIFDPDSGRFFIAMADTTRSRLQLLLAVSTSSSPETLSDRDWYVYRLDRNDTGVDAADFDHLAVAGDKLLVSWQRTGEPPGGPVGLGTTIRVFDKRPFTEGRVPADAPVDFVLPSTLNLRARPARGSAERDRETDRVFYDIWSQCGAANRLSWVIGAVSGLPDSPTFATREVSSPLPCVNNATTIPQPGGTPGIRIRRLAANPSYYDGRLWVFEWGDGATPGTTSGIQWMEVDVRQWPDNVTVLQAGVHREPRVWLFAPAGVVDWAGNMVLTFVRSGVSEFPSAGIGGRRVSDPAGTTRQGATLYQGQRTWDDINLGPLAGVLGAVIDPVDGSVWVTGITPTVVRPLSDIGKDSVATWIGRVVFPR